MTRRMSDHDLEGTVREAGINPATATPTDLAMADRFLQICQGDPHKAAARLKQWKEIQPK